MVGLEASSRDSLCDGRLAVYIAAPRGKGWLPRLLWKILMGRAEGYELEVLRVEQAVIETKASRVEVALDGEVLGLDAPLQYRIRPGALRVFVPADDREAGAAAR
jgi:diacylglycerol kinase family enzyme